MKYDLITGLYRIERITEFSFLNSNPLHALIETQFLSNKLTQFVKYFELEIIVSY